MAPPFPRESTFRRLPPAPAFPWVPSIDPGAAGVKIIRGKDMDSISHNPPVVNEECPYRALPKGPPAMIPTAIKRIAGAVPRLLPAGCP